MLRRWLGWGLARLLPLALLALVLLLGRAPLQAAAPPAAPLLYRCDGDLLEARADNGPVDAPGIPNTVAGIPPGAYVVLRWRELRLQLPRTNNGGPASYSDGQWWWSLEDPEQPSFRQRLGLGQIQDFSCQRLAAAD